MRTYERIAGLPVEIEGYALERLEQDVSSAFTRVTTVIRLRGGGEEGVGEDVTYDAGDHDVLQAEGATLPLAGSYGSLDELSRALEGMQLFPRPPQRPPSIAYRRWAFESAALDLALRQAAVPLHEALGREPRPVTYVVSLRLGEPPTLEPVRRRLERYPGLRFKLDATSTWTGEIFDELAALGVVDSIDLKGLYEDTVVDQGADADLYARVAGRFPDAWIEDPKLTPETDAVLRPHRDRVTWDFPIHSVADIDALPFPPRMVNVKPSRFGPLHELFDTYDECERRGITSYGGGQFELGPGRGHIQYLASLFSPDAPNDVAPSGFNLAEPPAGLPESPIPPQPAPTGFRWG